MQNRTVLSIALAASFFLCQDALTCGDSLYRVGKGTSYRNYSVPLPGNLLVFAGSEEARELAQQLADSGHEVYLVDSTEGLQQGLQTGGFDVVIAPLTQRATIESITEATTAFLPVTMDSEETKLAKTQYANVVRAADNIKRYLKAIHKTLKSRA